jgi:hypothetical protein
MYEVYIWQLGLRFGLDSIADIDKEIDLSVYHERVRSPEDLIS